jgi:protein TonB
MAKTEDKRENPEAAVSEAAPQPQTPEKLPSASTLVTNSLKIAALSAEIDRKLESRAQRPRQKFISASTREYKYAAYMEAWRAKVERIGNLNYPEAARQQGLSGSLILDVGLKPDGSIDDIIIRKSSGHKLLDDAAVRIVQLAAPYSPFTDDIKSETDILHITRTWQFLDAQGFR